MEPTHNYFIKTYLDVTFVCLQIQLMQSGKYRVVGGRNVKMGVQLSGFQEVISLLDPCWQAVQRLQNLYNQNLKDVIRETSLNPLVILVMDPIEKMITRYYLLRS